MNKNTLLRGLLTGLIALLWFLTTLVVVHRLGTPIFTKTYQLKTPDRVVEKDGYGFRILLPKESLKRDLDWDHRAQVLEDNFVIDIPALERAHVIERGKGEFKLSKKSIWLSPTVLNEDPRTNNRSYQLRVYQKIPDAWGIAAVAVSVLAIVGLIGFRRFRQLRSATIGWVLLVGACGVLGTATKLTEYTDRPAKGGLDSHPWFGTEHVPNSDAAHWVNGALSMVFYQDIKDPLVYRPTISLLYASFLKLHFALSTIPYVQYGCVALFLLFLLFSYPPSVTLPLCWFGVILSVFSTRMLLEMNPESLHLDFLSSALFFCGACLVMGGLHGRRRWEKSFSILVGFFAIGVTCAIRGPHLFGTLAFVALLFFKGGFRKQWGLGIASVICLFVPLVIDGYLRHQFEIQSNLPIALHAIVLEMGEPNEGWGTAVADYMATKPSFGEVWGAYWQYRLSPEGLENLLIRLKENLWQESSIVRTATFQALLFLAFLSRALLGSSWKRLRNGTVNLRGLLTANCFWVWLLFAIPAWVPPIYGQPAWVASCLIFLIYAAARGLVISFWMVATYVLATIFVVFLSNLGWVRVQTTFRWCIYLGIFVGIFEYSYRVLNGLRFHFARASLKSLPAAIILLFLSWGYLGNALVPHRESEETVDRLNSGDSLLHVSYCPDMDVSFLWSRDQFTYLKGPSKSGETLLMYDVDQLGEAKMGTAGFMFVESQEKMMKDLKEAPAEP